MGTKPMLNINLRTHRTWMEAIGLKKEAFWACLTEGSPEAADKHQKVSGAADLAVAEAKSGAWEEFREVIERDFRLASRKFWQTIR